MDLSICSQIDDKNLVVIKSVLQLRNEEWTWVEKKNLADIWITEIKDDFNSVIDATKEIPFVIFLSQNEITEKLEVHHHQISLPIRAYKLFKLFDLITSSISERKEELAKARHKSNRLFINENHEAPIITIDEGEHPWVGRNICLKGKPNLSSFPITAELATWLEIMHKQPVSYDSMSSQLAMDSELLEAVLNHAAKHNELVDEVGSILPPIVSSKNSLFDKLLGK